MTVCMGASFYFPDLFKGEVKGLREIRSVFLVLG